MAFWSTTESKLKLVVLFPHGKPNQYWYSPIKQNNLSDEYIINKMLGRLESRMQGCLKIQVYEVATDTLKYEIG